MSKYYKLVRLLEIDGKLEEIEETQQNKHIIQSLIKHEIAFDVGTKFVVGPPNCPTCGVPVLRALITNEKDQHLYSHLYCSVCGHIRERIS